MSLPPAISDMSDDDLSDDEPYDALPEVDHADFYYEAFCDEAESDIYDTDTVMLFTWSPDPNRYPSDKPHEQYRVLLDLIFYKAASCFSTFAFTPELNTNGSIHIHGWYVIRDKYKYFKWFLPKCKGLGWIKINKMTSRNALAVYYRKEIELMNQLMYEYHLPIPLTHKNIAEYATDRPMKKQLKNVVRNKKKFVHYNKMFPGAKVIKTRSDPIGNQVSNGYGRPFQSSNYY